MRKRSNKGQVRKVLNKKRGVLLLSASEAKQRRHDSTMARRILSVAQAALIMVGEISAITIRSFWPHPYYHAFCEHREGSIRSTLSRLQRNGFIERTKGGDSFFILTERGKEEYQAALSRLEQERERHKPWDGKWRVLIFDVPERHKGHRDFLRSELVEYGFVQLQKSVWISPFPAERKFKTTLEKHGMGPWIKLMIVDALFDEADLKAHFELS